jgi:hypothetical protein
MAVTKEFRCLAHGPFDAKDGICPRGCSTVVREFRTPPGGRSPKTKGVDKTLEGLASRFGLTDMTNRNDNSVGANRAQGRGNMDMQPSWGAMPKGNVFSVGKGEVQVDGAQGGATAALAGMGMGDNAAIAAMEAASGQPLPNFLDIAKTLPPVRPNIIKQSGTSADLDTAIARVK